MTSWPYVHTASAAITPEGQISVAGPEPAAVTTAGFQLGGVGDMGSPETLMVCALAWSFAIAFRAEMATVGIEWDALEIGVDATVDCNRRGPRFSRFDIHLAVDVPAGDISTLHYAADRALADSLVVNSLDREIPVAIRIDPRERIVRTMSTADTAAGRVASRA